MFTFSDHLPTPVAATLVVPIPATVDTKPELLRTLVQGLNIPGYFGWNWDALEECLRDLSWIPFPRHIVLFHEAVPLADNPGERSIYLDILKEAARDRGPGQPHVITVVFPTTFVLDPESGIASD